MSRRNIEITEPLYQYLLATSLREPPVFQQCRLETQELPMGAMQISPEEGQFLHVLVKVMGARKILDLGAFTGYSALWMASALPRRGWLIACETNRDWLAMARRYWEDARVLDRIEVRLGSAMEVLEGLREEGGEESLDMVFIDADKVHHRDYYEQSLKLLRPGGLVVVDSALWGGKVAKEPFDPDTAAIRELNRSLHEDMRVDISLLPVGDGLLLARKKEE